LQTIDALKAGSHVYVQKPISVDVMEGETMVAAARKYNRVVQVGTQRKSTPHLIEAKKNIVDAGLLGKVSHVEMCCYYHMRNNGNPPVQAVPDFFDYEMWTGLRLYGRLTDCRMYAGGARLWSMATGLWAICVFICLIPLGGCLGWLANRISSTGGIYVDKTGKSNIADTQAPSLNMTGLIVCGNTAAGVHPPIPNIPGHSNCTEKRARSAAVRCNMILYRKKKAIRFTRMCCMKRKIS